MRIATSMFLTDETITPVRLARELEERGFSGLYVPEHTHIPVERTSPYPLGGDLPPEYGRTLDPFVALAQAAAVTERLTLGTGITLVAQHDPIHLAKQVASLDHLSGGRFTFGVGYGWNREEAADHGVVWKTRRERVRRHFDVMRALWSAEPTAYEGEFGSVRASYAYPKPAGGAPRILFGGVAGPTVFRHITEVGDGWLPIAGGSLPEDLAALRSEWEAAGRDPEALHILPLVPRPGAEKLDRLADLGIREVVLQLPPAGADEVLRALDAYAEHL
ncbi:LLM class F420-dependent oxidoreductase [Streptomyces sp. LP05-1]|uniref:LLM class F420-dependent oxidoreductase n=1 Tax=Streptomyces pyxinae TaxID=2970734 RepID=A0ABT2CER0_9ACTN|nr:LLM class F420-dependent oxidoreductase [Streptomyces sp. LP05-1]MCS0635873.1 LLM class F420-dependent oxidoreductase [Streptomyces sp. LP05-1]